MRMVSAQPGQESRDSIPSGSNERVSAKHWKAREIKETEATDKRFKSRNDHEVFRTLRLHNTQRIAELAAQRRHPLLAVAPRGLGDVSRSVKNVINIFKL